MQAFLFVLLILSLTVSSSAFIQSLFHKVFPSKNQCPIKLYNPKDPSFTGVKLYTNAETFHPLLVTLSKYAKECHVKINVKQAFVQENPRLTTLKINDNTDMAFRLGEAIEFELVDQDKKLLCNNLCLQKELSSLRALPDAKCFLEKVSKDTDFRQDAIKPNLLIKRPKITESLLKLQDKRKDLQTKCVNLKIDA
jgi:hypothetical protein